MKILGKITFILFIGIVIFIWNKYVVANLIHKVIKKNPDNNWLAEKQTKITKGFQLFYWTGYIMFIISTLASE